MREDRLLSPSARLTSLPLARSPYDLLAACPDDLQRKNAAGDVVGCLTACGAWEDNEGESMRTGPLADFPRALSLTPPLPARRVLLQRRSRYARDLSCQRRQVLRLVEESVRPPLPRSSLEEG